MKGKPSAEDLASFLIWKFGFAVFATTDIDMYPNVASRRTKPR